MSSFDNIANEPSLVVYDGAAIEHDAERFRRELLDVVHILLEKPGRQSRQSMARLLRRACLEEGCRRVLLEIRGLEAQDVVNVLQMVRRRTA
jgi:hypothetical protein